MKRYLYLPMILLIGHLISTNVLALDLKDITYTTKEAGVVVFSHNRHLKAKPHRSSQALSCATCHTGDRTKKKYTMEDMYRGESCGRCHNGKQAFDAHQCSKCHMVKNVTYRITETGPLTFNHAAHLAKIKDCATCHSSLYKMGAPKKVVTMAEMDKGASCGACHNGKKAFKTDQCSRCHTSPNITYKLKSFTKASFSHTFHSQMYSCKDCHTGIVKPSMKSNPRVTMAEMEKGASCGACHDGKQAFTVAGSCNKCHVGLKQPTNVTYKNRFGTIVGRFNHTNHAAMLQCKDCHTKIYQYGAIKTRTTMKQMEQGASCGACHDGKQAFTVKSQCASCHKPAR